MANVFQVTSGGTFYDSDVYAAASGSLYQGRLVKKASGSTVSPTSSGDTPCGFAYGLRYGVYRPTTALFADGEAMAYVWGLGYCIASADLFMSGSVATAGQTCYAGDNGQMTVTAASNKKVGVCDRVVSYNLMTGGTGSAQSVSVIRFDISPFGV